MLKTDEYFMAKALRLAKKAMKRGEVPVGAVIVKDGKIIAKGYNKRECNADALAHAELIAIKKACKAIGEWRLINCSIYVTLEPCPMCAGAIINSRIERVVFGAYDPKAGACGSVIDLFSYPFNHFPKVTGGVMTAECSSILTKFFRKLRRKRAKR